MKVQGYRTLFRRGQTDVSDSVRLVLSRLNSLFEGDGMRTLQPRPEMTLTLETNRSDINYIKITYDSETDGLQKVDYTWYYFAEYDANSPATPGAAPYRLYVDWWAMLVDWYGEDPAGINIKRGHLIRSHKFITATADQKRGTGIAIQPHEPRKLVDWTVPVAGVVIVAIYHVSGSIFSIPGTDSYLQVVVPAPTGSQAETKQTIADSVSWLSRATKINYSLTYTDDQGETAAYNGEPDVSECIGIWIIPSIIFSKVLQNSPDALNSATIKCDKLNSTSVVVPIGLNVSKTFNCYVVGKDATVSHKMSIPGNLLRFRYFGNPGANIIIPPTSETLSAEIIATFSAAQNSFSVKFSAAGSTIDATNSLLVNVSTENAALVARNDIIKGGISAITAAVGAAVGGAAGFGAGLLLTGRGIANAAASGVGLSNYSRYSEGMNGIDNTTAIDYSAGENKWISSCALVEYTPDNVNEVAAEYNDHGATGTMSLANLNRDTGHNYNYVQFSDDLEIVGGGAPQECYNAVRDMLVRGVRIWNDTNSTNFLGGTTWQSSS